MAGKTQSRVPSKCLSLTNLYFPVTSILSVKLGHSQVLKHMLRLQIHTTSISLPRILTRVISRELQRIKAQITIKVFQQQIRRYIPSAYTMISQDCHTTILRRTGILLRIFPITT